MSAIQSINLRAEDPRATTYTSCSNQEPKLEEKVELLVLSLLESLKARSSTSHHPVLIRSKPTDPCSLAFDHFMSVVDAYRGSPDKIKAAECYRKAACYYSEAADDYRDLPDEKEAAKCYKEAAYCYKEAADLYQKNGDIKEAAEHYKEAAYYCREPAYCYREAAGRYQENGDIKEAAIHYKEAAYHYKEAAYYYREAAYYYREAAVADRYKKNGDIEEAAEYYRKAGYYWREAGYYYGEAADLYQKNGGSRLTVKVYSRLAAKYYRLSADDSLEGGSRKEAADCCYIKAAEIYREIGDSKKAAECYTKVADLYEKNRGSKKAIKYYDLAARQENVFAQMKLGWIYQYNKADMDKVVEGYELAAGQGNADAQRRLGDIYQYKKGDVDKAIEYYRLAERQEDKVARFALFKLKERSEGGDEVAPGHIYRYSKENIYQTIGYFKPEAELGDIDSQIIMGRIHQYDAVNFGRSMEYFYSAAKEGSFEAQTRLGCLMQENRCFYRDEDDKLVLPKDVFGLLLDQAVSEDQIRACLQVIGIDKVSQMLSNPRAIEDENPRLYRIMRQVPDLPRKES